MTKKKKTIFAIMPFSKTPGRSKEDLTEFFMTNLKEPIESADLKYQYIVKRSDDTFDITAQIIRDIYEADVVLCDLSGHHANPNVMYELGIRLSLTNKPVILFREKHDDNKPIFDIAGFHAYEYSCTQYRKLEKYIIDKINKFESGEERYESPVLKVLKTSPSIIAELNKKRARILMDSLRHEAVALQRGLSGAISSFFDEHSIEHTFSTPEETFQFLHENADQVKDLPWSELGFIPNIMPALNAYLVEMPMDDLIDEKIERLTNTFLHEFYNHFLASQYRWTHLDFGALYAFLGECFNMRQIIAGCIYLISDPAEEEIKEIVDQMHEHFTNNIFGIMNK